MILSYAHNQLIGLGLVAIIILSVGMVIGLVWMGDSGRVYKSRGE